MTWTGVLFTFGLIADPMDCRRQPDCDRGKVEGNCTSQELPDQVAGEKQKSLGMKAEAIREEGCGAN